MADDGLRRGRDAGGLCVRRGQTSPQAGGDGDFRILAVAFFVGPLLDTCSVFLVMSRISIKGAMAFYISGFSVNLRQAVATAIVLLVLGKPLLEKLDRIKTKYGILDDEGGKEA